MTTLAVSTITKNDIKIRRVKCITYMELKNSLSSWCSPCSVEERGEGAAI